MTAEASIDLSEPRSVFIVGIGGSGMSAIAAVLARWGHTVSGSDLKSSRDMERLPTYGVTTHVGHSPDNLPAVCDALVHSTAVPLDHPELVAARERGIPVLRRADMLAAMSRTLQTIAIAGSHGKTTTTSMLTLMLRRGGLQPSFLVGAEVNEMGTNAGTDAGAHFIVEADESDGTFLELARAGAIVTNVEPDHLDHYGGFAQLEAAFRKFVADTSGPVVLCLDDAGSAALVGEAQQPVTYGFAESADVRIADYEGSRQGSRFTLVRNGVALGVIELPVAGKHNARNATGAAAMALELGASFEAIAAALAGYGGVARRFQVRGEYRGATLIDDYAHLPSEVKAAISAAREGEWNRVIVVFQPHRYSRTHRLWRDFAGAFDEADLVILTDIYSSGEAPIPGVSAHLILEAVLDATPDLALMYLPHRADLLREIPKLLQPGDLLLTLGAGDLTTLPDEVMQA